VKNRFSLLRLKQKKIELNTQSDAIVALRISVFLFWKMVLYIIKIKV